MQELKLTLYFLFFFSAYIISPQAQSITKVPAEEYQEKKTVLVKVYTKEYLTLAKWCKTNKLYPEAEKHFQNVLKYEPDNNEAKHFQNVLKYDTDNNEARSEFGKGVPNPQISEQVLDEYDKKLVVLKKKLADEHTKLGAWCKQNKLSEEAEKEFEQAIELYEDNPETRKQLGQEKVNGFGWVDKESTAKLKQGLREYQGKWLPRSEVEKIRSDWANAMEIKTKHYLVKTNTTHEKGYEIAEYAEDVYQMYFKIFGRTLKLREMHEPMNICFYRSREEIDRYSGLSLPKGTAGVYRRSNRVAHFYDTNPNLLAKEVGKKTIYSTLKDIVQHECTHQLNHLIGGLEDGVWLDEGLATYFESVQRDKKGDITIGQKNHYRFYAPIPNIPLSNFLQMRPGADINTPEEYRLAATFTRYFLNGNGVKYKQMFLNYVKRLCIASVSSSDSLKVFEECFAGIGISLESIEKEFWEGWNK
jgi:tetratricopeptide (TPR) repeat protein